MKRVFIVLTILLVLISFVSSNYNNVSLGYSSKKTEVVQLLLKIGDSKMIVGENVFDLYASPETLNNTIYIPVTAIAKGFGTDVEWAPESLDVIITFLDIRIDLRINEDIVLINGNPVTIKPVYLKNGIPMVPLEVLTEGLLANISFDQDKKILTVSSSMSNFDKNLKWITVLYPKDGLILPSGIFKVSPYSSITFTIIPKEFYNIKDVKVDGESVGSVKSYTFDNINLDHSLEVIFEPYAFSINAYSSLGGNILPNGNIKAEFNETKTFKIVPNKGYVIKDVSVDGHSIGTVSSYTFEKITSNHTIYAEFEKEFVLTYITLEVGSKKALVNGDTYVIDVPATIIENRTYVPLRFVAEQLNCDVKWDSAQKKITITNGNTKIELWIGKSSALVNGKSVPIDSTNSKVVPIIKDGRTLVPIRFVSESLGFYVDYNSAKKLVLISNAPIVNLDGAVGYLEKTINYKEKSYYFKVIKIDPKVKGIKFLPSLSVNGFNKGANYKSFLLPNTVVLVNGLPFDTDTFETYGTIFGNMDGKIAKGFVETLIIDHDGNCSYEEGEVKVKATITNEDKKIDEIILDCINKSTFGRSAIYTKWYKDDIYLDKGEVLLITNGNGLVINKVLGPGKVNPSKLLSQGYLGILTYERWGDSSSLILSDSLQVKLKITINDRDITNSFFVQSSPLVVKDGKPFDGASRYPDSYRMTKSGARVFIATDGRYVYFIITPTPMSLRNDPAGEIILKLGYFKYVLSLDGGGSTTFYYRDKFVYTPGRQLVTCVAVVNEVP
ncbi:MAG: stalk domain-containing protein [Nitrososphaeria archaeon]